MTPNMTPQKLIRFCLLFLPLLLSLSGFQSAFAQAPQAVNLSTRLQVGTGFNVGIAGFILKGTNGTQKQVVVRARGPFLSSFVPNVLANPMLELSGPGVFLTNNDCACPITNPPGAPGAPEAAIDTTLASGPSVNYTAMIQREGNTALGIGLVEIYDITPATGGKLGNISTRGFVGTGDDIIIAGFILSTGTGMDNIIVRGLGPTLANSNIPNVLANPTLELRNANGTLLAENNDWQDDATQADIISMAQLALPDPLESGIAKMLGPGMYTALLRGLNNTTGIGLVEVYDLGP